MQVSTASNVQIYNLSAGKRLPKWISNEARRKLEKRNIDVRRRIELIQDFEMPDLSHTVNTTPDGRFIFVSGAYKPMLKCYDVNDLSLKFERGLDADVVKMIVLSEDCSKIVLLQQDRYLEMHAAFGRYFRMRMPKFGRDMAYSRECSDLYLVGASSEIYRLNLEQGEWLSPLESLSTQINCCSFADEHQLFVCGTNGGKVEAFDHRERSRVGVLDCVAPLLNEQSSAEVTSLRFLDALNLGVGTSTGHIMLFDLRSRKPLLVKDHRYGLPIKKIDYVKREDEILLLSMDSRVLKMWNSENGKAFAAIETESLLTDFALYPNSGLIFFSNEAPRMQQHFVPALGPAPKWCSFLEMLTEELEESEAPTVYDDYKFVTSQQLESFGLGHLVGTSVLRAYMHGYFIDSRLYSKAQTLTQPFAFEKYKERKVKDILEEERETNIIVSRKEIKLPKVNKEMALHLQEDIATGGSGKSKDKRKSDAAVSILQDSRFQKMFEVEDFQIDTDNTLSTSSIRKRRDSYMSEIVNVEENDKIEESMESEMCESHENPGNEQSALERVNSEDEELERKQKEKQKRKQLAKERSDKKYKQRKTAEEEERLKRLTSKPKKFVLVELANGETSTKFMDETPLNTEEKQTTMLMKKRRTKKPGQLEHVEDADFGGRTMTFTLEKKGKAAREEREKKKKEEHQKERREVVRRTTDHVAHNLKRLPSNLKV